ncbi:unnamed protein product [Knipowitschia caucasica]
MAAPRGSALALAFGELPHAASPHPGKRWVYSREQLLHSPSHRCGVEPDRELSYRQQAANLIQDMGQRLNVSQLTINTAIVYMHRFYMQHSFTKFHRNIMSPATLFLAAKVEEQPRKLEHVIKVAHACLNPTEPPLDTKSNAYLQQAQELVVLEAIVLQTLGFEVTIDHPHTDVVKCTQLVRASKDLAQTSYFMATNSLHLTTFCLQHPPTVIACVCIHLACKWSNWEIPVSTDGKHWWEYVDGNVSLKLLDELTHEFLQILEKTPSRLKRIRNWRATQAAKKPRSDSDLAGPGSALPLEPPPPGSAPSTSAQWPAPGRSLKDAPKMSLERYREKHKTDSQQPSVDSGSHTLKGKTGGGATSSGGVASVGDKKQRDKRAWTEECSLSFSHPLAPLSPLPDEPEKRRRTEATPTSQATPTPAYKSAKVYRSHSPKGLRAALLFSSSSESPRDDHRH